MTDKIWMKRTLAFCLGVVLLCTYIIWPAKREAKAEDTTVVIEQTPGEASRSGGDGLSRWSNDAWGFRLKNDYITHTFDVPVSGKYQLLHKGAVEGTGIFDVTVDRIPSGSITLTGTDGNAEIETDAGAYYFEAGKHTVTFTYAIDTENYSTVYLKTILKQIDSTTVVELQDHEKDEVTTTSPNGYSDFSSDDEGGYIGFWDTQTVTFQNVAIPEAGIYGVYVDCGSDSDTNTWKATLNEKTLSDTAPNTGSCIAFERQKLGQIELEEGNVTLHLEANITSGVLSMIRVVFVWECNEEPVKLLETSEEANYQAYTLVDFNISDGSLSYVGNQTVDYGATLDKTLFRAKLYFPQEPFGNLIWGGNDWNGLNITMDRNGTGIYITVISNTANVIQEFWIAPDVAGIPLIGNENLEFAISTVFLDKDDVAGTAKLKLGIWLNGALYSNKYFISDTIAMADFTRHLHGQSITESLKGISIVSGLREEDYTSYTLSDAGIADGKGDVLGRLYNCEKREIVRDGYNRILFGAKVTFQTPGGRIHYAADEGQMYDGIQIRLEPDGTLVLEDYSESSATFEVMNYKKMVIDPMQFGYTSFENQSIKLQLTTDVFAMDSSEKDDVRLGIWIDGLLANNTYCYIMNQLQEFGNGLNFCLDTKAIHYSLWSVDAPTGKIENYVQIKENSPYLVESDTFTNLQDNKAYSMGETVKVSGDYKAIYETNGEAQAGEKSVVLWKNYDTHADGVYDSRDLVAMKKAAAGITLQSKAAQMAASRLESDMDCESMRSYLIGKTDNLNKEVPAIWYQTDKNGKVMPISGWVTPASWLGFKVDAGGNLINNYMQYGAETDFLQEKYYDMIRELGVNLLVYQNKNYAEYNEMQVLKGLSLAEKYGMNFYVTDSGISDNESDEKVLANRINAYSRYSSFAGIQVVDEPRTDYYFSELAQNKHIKDISEVCTRLNSYANLTGYVNLFGSTDIDLYTQYVDEYIKECNPTQLSFDSYPLSEGGNYRKFFQSLKVMREKSIANDISFVGCINTTTTAHSTEPNTGTNKSTQGEFNWSANMLLAHGAKGYTWFTLIEPREYALVGNENGITGMDFNRVGLIGADGSKTGVFDFAKNTNQWAAKIDHILMESTSLAVLAKGSRPQEFTGYTETSYGNMSIGSVSPLVTGGVIVGVFDYRGKMAYYVVNYSHKAGATVELKFNTAGDFTIYNQTSNEVTEVSGVRSQGITLGHGAAALLIEK